MSYVLQRMSFYWCDRELKISGVKELQWDSGTISYGLIQGMLNLLQR